MEINPIFLLCDPRRAFGDLCARNFSEMRPRVMKKLPNTCANVQQVTFSLMRQKLFQPALPQRITLTLLFDP
jgi:hypothetical protein